MTLSRSKLCQRWRNFSYLTGPPHPRPLKSLCHPGDLYFFLGFRTALLEESSCCGGSLVYIYFFLHKKWLVFSLKTGHFWGIVCFLVQYLQRWHLQGPKTPHLAYPEWFSPQKKMSKHFFKIYLTPGASFVSYIHATGFVTFPATKNPSDPTFCPNRVWVTPTKAEHVSQRCKALRKVRFRKSWWKSRGVDGLFHFDKLVIWWESLVGKDRLSPCLHWKILYIYIYGQNYKYFTNLDSPEIRGFPFQNATFWGGGRVRSLYFGKIKSIGWFQAWHPCTVEQKNRHVSTRHLLVFLWKSRGEMMFSTSWDPKFSLAMETFWKHVGKTTNHHGKTTIRVSGMDRRPEKNEKQKTTLHTLPQKKARSCFSKAGKGSTLLTPWEKKRQKMKNENKKRPRSIASLESYKKCCHAKLESQPVWMMSVAIPSESHQKVSNHECKKRHWLLMIICWFS